MPNVSLTGIEFTIKGSADKASASVDSLIQKLSNLNAALSNGANARAFAKGLEGIAKAANSLSGTNIAGAKSALEQLSKSMKSFKSFGDSLKGVATFGNAMSKLAAKPENLMQVAEILAKIATIDFTNIKEAGEGLRNIAAAANSLAKIPQATKETGDAAKKANSPLKTFLKSLGRIAFYRIIRGILKSITQAFQEGLKNAYMFDKVAGGGLADALDNLATKSLTMKNQLGAAFGGLLTAITPVVIQIIKIVTALASAITRLIAILGGSSQWLRAKDVWTEWGDAAEGAGGAAKEALKYLAPFDELNVLPSQRSGGGGGGSDTPYGDMFEWVDTDVGGGFLESITEAFSKLADWFQSKDWQDIGSQAWQTLKDIFTDGTAANEAVTSFMEALGSAFGAIVGTAWGFIHDLVEDLAIQFKRNLIDYNGDGKLTATDFLKAVLKTGGDIVDWVYETLVKPFFDGFGRALTGDNTFDFTNWAKEYFLNPIIRAWNTFTQEMLNPFIEGINRAIDYINDQFNTNIPHIPLIGEVAELEVKVPNKDRKIPNGMMTVKEFEDSVPTTKKTIGGVTANATNVKDGISKDKKWFEYFGADISSLHDKIDKRYKKVDGIQAAIDKVDTAKLTIEQKRIATTANMANVRTADLNETQRNIRTNAVMKSVNAADLTNAQRQIRTTANMQNVRTTDLKDEARRIRTTANLQSAVNNIPKAQLSLASTAEVKAKVIKSSLQDPYTGNLQLDATAHISRITGQTTVPIQYGNGIAGGMSASGGVSYSIESGDNEEVLYRAMSRALSDSELGGDIELDGEVLYKRMVNRNRANTRLTGVNALA